MIQPAFDPLRFARASFVPTPLRSMRGPAPIVLPPAAVSSVSVMGEGTVLLAEDDRPVRRLVVTELGRHARDLHQGHAVRNEGARWLERLRYLRSSAHSGAGT